MTAQDVLGGGTKLLVASHNEGKIGEFRQLLEPLGIEVVSLREAGLPEPEETGTTFEENADLKSVAAASATGLPALADDSGICVEALDGAPGVYTADWTGEPRDYAVAYRRVDRELREKGLPGAQGQRATFVSVLSLAFPDGRVVRFRGESAGTLVWPVRGTNGFGFDPMFQPEGFDRTFGEMTTEEKQGPRDGGPGLSHRSRSFHAFATAMLGAEPDGPKGP